MTDPSPLTLLTEVLEGAMSTGRAARIVRAVVASCGDVELALGAGLVPDEVVSVVRARVAEELSPAVAEQVVELVRARVASARPGEPVLEGARQGAPRRSGSVPRGAPAAASFPRPMSGVRPTRRSTAKRETPETRADGSPAAPCAPLADASREAVHVARADITVLVVEDDAVVRMVYARLLRRAGYEVVEAADGAAGLDKALLLRPAVVVCDYQMPKMDGQRLAVELQRCLGEQAPPVVLVTGISALDGPLPGVALLRHKPLPPGELVAIVDQLRQRVGRRCGRAGR